MKNFVKILGIIITAAALLVAACSTDTKVLPKKPVIKEQPQSNQYAQDAEAVPLTVTATTKDKKAKLAYQWYSNTKPSTKGSAKVAGASGALTSGVEGGEFTPLTDTIGTVYYYVEVTSTLNKEKAKTTSEVAVVTIIDPKDMPVISASNGDPTATGGGDDVVLTVTLPESIEELLESGDYEVSYQWYSNARNSNIGGTIINGATDASFMPDTLVEGTTYYYVVITVKDKETGEVVKTLTSNPMRVTVITNVVNNKGIDAPGPFITTHPRSASYFIGLPVTPLTVTATVKDLEGIPNVVTYQWYRNTENNNTGGEAIESADDSSYTPPTDVVGVVYYYVIVTNTIQDNGDGGKKSNDARSTVARIETKKGVDAQVPAISVHPVDGFYALNAAAKPLSVEAAVTDGGDLSYQWYKKLENSNISGELIAGATNVTYVPPTNATKSIFFYYVEVTNKIADNGDGGKKTASAKSNPACVGVEIVPAYLGGLTAQNKPYDGTNLATFTGSPSFTSNGTTPMTLTNATIHVGTGEFAQVDAGDNIPVTLKNWYLEGSNAGAYFLYVPTNLKANITKATGGVVAAVTLNVKTNNSITGNPVTTMTGQSVEYNISKVTNNTGFLLAVWQETPVFTGLSAATNYYIYARSVANSNYNTGANVLSVAIMTEQPVVIFETDGGTVMAPVTVTKGGKLNISSYTGIGTQVPTREDYTFDWWYTDAALTTPYLFSAGVNDNMTLYVRWVANADIAAMRSTKEMEWIPSGVFIMGSPITETGRSSENQHEVGMSGFYMGKYEVTQEKWTAVMGDNPSNFKAEVGGELGTPGRLPVENVSWYDAIKFCNMLSIQESLRPAYKINGSIYPGDWGAVPTTDTSLTKAAWDAVQIIADANGYRLPTEAQWEYACRAVLSLEPTDYRVYNTGNTINDNTGWYTTNSSAKTHRGGLKATNAWGLYDMHGNVAEWCWDWYLADYGTAAQINPGGPTSGTYRVVRGGNWSHAAASLRSASRNSFNPYVRGSGSGLRLVRP